MKNENFTLCLKRKLRLPIFNDCINYACRCGKKIDPFGDHCLGCKSNHKTCTSNAIRDGIIKTFSGILVTCKLIESLTQVEGDVERMLLALKSLRPFDLSGFR
jgi:hypothetical protein